MAAAVRVLQKLEPDVGLEEHLIGGAAIAETGTPLPDETLTACLGADAVLFGAAGVADLHGPVRAEDGLIALRRELDVYANLRPSKSDRMDLIIVRELVGGLYYGDRGRRADGAAFDTCVYAPAQIERIARRAFEIARTRDRRLTSVDKANVLETSRLWREVVVEVAKEYPDVALDHVLVDAAGLYLVREPGRFDVIVTENTFGDILSDVAAGLAGGLGLAASASLGDHGPGLFEPVHGSAPDIAGRGIANPYAILRSVAMMLEYGLGAAESAQRLTAALELALAEAPTRDLGGTASTDEFTDFVLGRLEEVPV
jgi:3-isopropylmalate dehydrogenase